MRPLRGDLSIEKRGVDGCSARLIGMFGLDLLSPLLSCRVVPVRGQYFIVSGVQEVDDSTGLQRFERQAWLCQLPSAPAPASQPEDGRKIADMLAPHPPRG